MWLSGVLNKFEKWTGMALVKFRNRLVRDPFGALSNWNDDREGDVLDHCSWFGVECADGKVISLWVLLSINFYTCHMCASLSLSLSYVDLREVRFDDFYMDLRLTIEKIPILFPWIWIEIHLETVLGPRILGCSLLRFLVQNFYQNFGFWLAPALIGTPLEDGGIGQCACKLA